MEAPATTPHKEKLSTFICITQHTIDRFCEIVPEVEDLPDEKIKGIVLAMYRDGDKFGGQHGNDFFIKGTHNSTGREVVFPCVPGRGNSIIVKTVLSFEVAMANMYVSNKAVWSQPNNRQGIQRKTRNITNRKLGRVKDKALVPDNVGNRWD